VSSSPLSQISKTSQQQSVKVEAISIDHDSKNNHETNKVNVDDNLAIHPIGLPEGTSITQARRMHGRQTSSDAPIVRRSASKPPTSIPSQTINKTKSSKSNVEDPRHTTMATKRNTSGGGGGGSIRDRIGSSSMRSKGQSAFGFFQCFDRSLTLPSHLGSLPSLYTALLQPTKIIKESSDNSIDDETAKKDNNNDVKNDDAKASNNNPALLTAKELTNSVECMEFVVSYDAIHPPNLPSLSSSSSSTSNRRQLSSTRSQSASAPRPATIVHAVPVAAVPVVTTLESTSSLASLDNEVATKPKASSNDVSNSGTGDVRVYVRTALPTRSSVEDDSKGQRVALQYGDFGRRCTAYAEVLGILRHPICSLIHLLLMLL
jgi:hypothetical protein